MPSNSVSTSNSLPPAGGNSLDQFLKGIMTPIRAVGVIFSSPKLITWSALPILATIVVLSVVFYALLAGLWTWAQTSFTGYFANYSGALAVIMQVIAAVVFLYFAGYSLSILTSFFASPFNDILAESAERVLGVTDTPPTTTKRLLRVFFLDLRKTVIALSLSILFSLILLIPVAGLIGFVGIAWLNTFTFVTYPQSRRETGVRDSMRWIRRNLPASLGFGATLIVLFTVPVINIFALPVAVVGGTLLYIERSRSS